MRPFSTSLLAQPFRKRSVFIQTALPRGLALFLGTFCLLNLFIQARRGGFDGNLWWIDLHFLPAIIAEPFLFLGVALMLSFGFVPVGSAWRRWLTFAGVCLLALATTANAIQFYALLYHGTIHSAIPLAFSFLLTIALAVLLFGILRQSFRFRQQTRRIGPQVTAVFLACFLAFPLLQMGCFGKTDYRRRADAVVVFGARAYADGRPSDALADRVRTACGLYREGLVHKLIFSGGPGDGAITESEAMKRMALKLGVKPDDIILDEHGINTHATVKNTETIFRELSASRILVVSHFYHLPRVKVAYHQAGIEVYTVPARESYLLRQLPYNMAREVAAFWTYYLRPIA